MIQEAETQKDAGAKFTGGAVAATQAAEVGQK